MMMMIVTTAVEAARLECRIPTRCRRNWWVDPGSHVGGVGALCSSDGGMRDDNNRED